MGSTGTGKFTDYPGSKPKQNGDLTGGSSGIDECARAFSSRLEDVSACTYFTTTANIPPIGTSVELYFDKRIIVRTLDGIDLGYLPTKFNYLKICMDGGYIYQGFVRLSALGAIPVIEIDIAPIS